MPMRVLVCGGRDITNRAWVERVLSTWKLGTPIDLLIEGGAPGVDRFAREWAQKMGIPVQTYETDCHQHGRSPGPIRNQTAIIDDRPYVVLAFPGGKGTRNVIEQVGSAGMTVLICPPPRGET